MGGRQSSGAVKDGAQLNITETYLHKGYSRKLTWGFWRAVFGGYCTCIIHGFGAVVKWGREDVVRRNKRIWDAWLACDTEEAIAEREGLTQQAVGLVLENHKKLDAIRKLVIFSTYADPDWKPPLYDVWKVQNKSDGVLRLSLFTEWFGD